MKYTKTIAVVFACVFMFVACNNNKTDKSKVDPTPVLDQANNSYPTNVDTLGFQSDSATKKTEKGSNLIASSDCLTCHKIKEKLVGPAYVAVADKYPVTAENINYLASKIIKGGKGVWGEVPMTPHPAVSNEDATEMVNYILSLKDVK